MNLSVFFLFVKRAKKIEKERGGEISCADKMHGTRSNTCVGECVCCVCARVCVVHVFNSLSE